MLTLIREYIKEGLVVEKVHPDYPELSIFNYTAVCQFKKFWNPVTKACRGLIMNTVTGDVVAQPWHKFFNLAEHNSIPKGLPYVKDKLDGSLGIVFWYDNRWHISTRGSFVSEQAIEAKKWIEGFDFPKGFTHLFEIIYPENRIVVDYGGYRGLVYLGSTTISGREIDLDFWPDTVDTFGQVHPDDLPNRDNREGFVLYWPREDFRVKVKYDEYVRLHRVVTGYSIKRLWEVVSTGQNLDEFLEGVPDEFYDKVTKDEQMLRYLCESYLKRAEALYLMVKDMPTRKEQAQTILKHDRDCATMVFGLLDNKDNIETQAWNKVKQWLN